MRIGEYREELFLEEIALTVRHRRIELELGAVRGHRELERVIVGLARVRLLDREKAGVELLHARAELLQRLSAPLLPCVLGPRQGYFVERHMERLETRRLLVDASRHKPCRDIAHEIAVEVVLHMRIIELLHPRERVLDPLLLHRPPKLL